MRHYASCEPLNTRRRRAGNGTNPVNEYRLISPIEPLTPTCQCRYVCVREYTHPRFQPYIFGLN